MNIWTGLIKTYLGNIIAAFLLSKKWRKQLRYKCSLWGDYKNRRYAETRFSKEEKRKQKLVMTLLVKDEEILIDSHLAFHLAQGVDKIIVTDNGSTDETRNILDQYEKAGLIEVIDEPSKAYHQKAFVNRMVKRAIEKFEAKWIINADADEFFYSRTEQLKDALPLDEKPNILFCQWYLALPRAGQKWQDINHFYPVDKSKAIHTVTGFRSVSEGNHKVYLDHIHSPSMTDDIILYHLQARDFKSYKVKIENKYYHCLHTRNKKFSAEMKEKYEAICLQNEKSAHIYYDHMIEKNYLKVALNDGIVRDNRFAEFMKKQYLRV